MNAWDGLFLFCKLTLEVLLGKKVDSLNRIEYKRMIIELIGFSPTYVIGYKGIRFDLNNIFGPDTFLAPYAQLILIGAQSISKKNIYGKIFIDAGANVGVFSIFVALLGAKKVYAFEPVPSTYNILVRTIRSSCLESTIVPINMALGAKKGKVVLNYAYAGDGRASIDFATGSMRSISRVVTIDGFMARRGRVDFIKIDTEGYEGNVIRGARKTIKLYAPTLSLSIHRKEDNVFLPKMVKAIRKDYSCEHGGCFAGDICCEINQKPQKCD